MLKPHILTKHFPSSTREWNNNIYKINIKKEYLKKILKIYKKELNKKFNLIKYHTLLNNKSKIFMNLNQNYSKYIVFFSKKLLKKTLIRLNTYMYYKQLIYINKSKYNFTYLQYIQKYLERLYNKNVEFNLVNLKRFYLHSDI